MAGKSVLFEIFCKRFMFVVMQVKELLKREVEKGDVETQSKTAIIADYKNICSQLSERLDKEQAANTRTINMYKVSSHHLFPTTDSALPRSCFTIISPAFPLWPCPTSRVCVCMTP